MLIDALCHYYAELEKNGKVVPEGYSEQNVHFLICLAPDGTIDAIVNWQIPDQIPAKNGKVKNVFIPKNILLPQRTEKTGIESNIIEHRPLYIFGLNFEKDHFTSEDKTEKAKKSNIAFKEANLAFIEGLDSPIINAYRNFLHNWIPENETENPCLKEIGKAYKNSYFAFCLSGQPDILLHDDILIRQKWEECMADVISDDAVMAQCAVTGKNLPIARIHNKIRGIVGGQSSGTVLVGYKTTAGCSYGNEQSYNSNISEAVMNQYTYALNSLLSDKNHRNLIDDVTVIFWATGGKKNEECADLFNMSLFGSSDKMDEKQTDQMLKSLFIGAREGKITADKIASTENIDENADFYIVGLKPNASRVAVKFIYRRKFGQILSCIAQHQSDMRIGDEIRAVPLWKLKNELKSPKSSNDKIDASLLSEIFKSILYGTPYPDYLLSNLLMRIKTDRNINHTRAGAVKACINRKSRYTKHEEELKLALDKENTNQAYLCGRLFAVLQKIQENAAAPAKLNRTIKDTYFASAASKPALVFPKLLTLSQNHIKKLSESNAVFFNKLVEEIIGKLDGEFPEMLMLTEQGKFMIGYYQQDQDFYKKNDDKTKEEN